MPLATLQQLLDRVDTAWLLEVTLTARATEPPTLGELAERDRRALVALDDASAELLAYKPRIASAFWPDSATLVTHCVRVALHLLTANRPGRDFASIKDARDAVIKFYEDAVTQTAASGGAPIGITADAPERVFTERGLKGLT